jgi:cell wall assembly regulator SMI1
MPLPSVSKSWERIERWLADNLPAAVPLLPNGASADTFAQAEDTLGFAIPKEIKDFLTIHDGSGNLWLHDYGEFMSVAEILVAWDQEVDLWGDGNNDEWATPHGPIRKVWFSRKWLPVLNSRTGNYLCADLAPAKGGKRGQIIWWAHDGGPMRVEAAGFRNLLAKFVEHLEAGRYTPKANRVGQPYLAFDEP